MSDQTAVTLTDLLPYQSVRKRPATPYRQVVSAVI